MGRFLTPDSIIPDITNGQALNAYAYVYNDPVNLVDPSGNVATGNTPRELIGAAAQKGLDFLDWYLSEPNSGICSCKDSDAAFFGPVGGVIAQGVNGVVTTPADMYGTKTVETLVTRQVERSVSTQWLRDSRIVRRMPIVRALMPSRLSLGHRTVRTWVASAPVQGTLDELLESGILRQNGIHNIGTNRRVTITTKPRARPGPTGFAGAAAWAAWIDGFTQLFSDWQLCLSPMQKANRFAATLGLGLASGAFAGAVFAGGTWAAATAGTSVIGAKAIPLLAGLAAGYYAAGRANRLKAEMFAREPELFGGK